MVNTGQQLGGAIGVAVALTVATTHAKSLTPPHMRPSAAALTSGYAQAFWVMAGVAFAGAVVAFILVRVRGDALTEADVEPEPAG